MAVSIAQGKKLERKTETLGELKIGKDKGFKIELVMWSLKQRKKG